MRHSILPAHIVTQPFVEDRSVLARPARPPDHVFRYGSEPEHIADIRFAEAEGKERPLVVMIHGGFWRPQFDRTHTGPMCEALANAGWTNASIEYRRIPGDPDTMVNDVRDALEALSGARFGNGRLILLGHSAGGHLCLYVAAIGHSRLVGALALAPAADLLLAEQLNLGTGAARAFLGVAAGERADLDPARLPSPTVPTTILHGQQDEIVPLSVSQAYANHHPRTRLVIREACGHFAVIDPASDTWRVLVEELKRLGQ